MLKYGNQDSGKTAPHEPLHASGDARRTAPAAARQPGPAAGEGLCRGLRGRGLLAGHLRPLPQPLPALRNLGARPRRPAQGQKGAHGHDPRLVGGDAAVRRFGLRLPVRRTHRAVEGGPRSQIHVPHLRLRHRELPLLRPLAAQRLREGHQERYAHLRLRALHARLLVHDLPALRVVCLLGTALLRERLPAHRLQVVGTHRLPRPGGQRGQHAGLAAAQRREARTPPRTAQPPDDRADAGV